MAICPNCNSEISVPSNFCPRCRYPLGEMAQPPSPPQQASAQGQGSIRVGDVSVQANVESNVAREAVQAQQAAQKVVQELELEGRTRPSEGARITDVGDKQYHYTVNVPPEKVVYCRCCGVRFNIDFSYTCPHCGRGPICPKDFNTDKRRCCDCLTEETRPATVHCALCGQAVPQADTFSCPKCHRVVGKDHLHVATNMCQACAQDYEQFVARLRQGKLVVSPTGDLLTPDDADRLVAERGELRTAEGEHVARLKDQMWYSPQWHLHRPGRFQMEQESMNTFYPHMELCHSRTGEVYWKGQITTRLGKTYDFEIHYPQAFPYQPPKAYITSPPIKKSRHIYEDGHLCLFHLDDRAWDQGTTAATVVSWIAKWLHCYEVWLATGEWPGRERDQVVVTVKG